MPLATRRADEGRREERVVGRDVGRRAGWPSTGAVSWASSRLRLGTLRSEISRPKVGSSSPGFFSSTRRSMVRSPSKASWP